jgi:hypothetical protein
MTASVFLLIVLTAFLAKILCVLIEIRDAVTKKEGDR